MADTNVGEAVPPDPKSPQDDSSVSKEPSRLEDTKQAALSEESSSTAGDDEERADEDAEGSLEEKLERVRSEALENYDRYLRAMAELENYRKRTAKVRSESREEALRDILLQIAPMLDNIRRALAQESVEGDAFRQGIELIHSQFDELLKGYGLEAIESIGQPFDPMLHEAMLEVEYGDHPPGTIVEEMERGYKLNERVVRPSRVIVSKAQEAKGEGTE